MYVVIQNTDQHMMLFTLDPVLCIVSKRSKAVMLADRLPRGRVMTLREAKKQCDDLNYQGIIQRLLIN